jgi:hypothetical protein
MSHAYATCSRCLKPIDTDDPGATLSRKGHLLRLRCQWQECGHTDWYSESELSSSGQIDAEAAASVALHDFLLNATHEIVPDIHIDD